MRATEKIINDFLIMFQYILGVLLRHSSEKEEDVPCHAEQILCDGALIAV